MVLRPVYSTDLTHFLRNLQKAPLGSLRCIPTPQKLLPHFLFSWYWLDTGQHFALHYLDHEDLELAYVVLQNLGLLHY